MFLVPYLVGYALFISLVSLIMLLCNSTYAQIPHSSFILTLNVQVKLEVMGKKAKNATFISGNEAGKISKEIQKVEKRRIVKSTLCNERSSRSHCMVWTLNFL